MVSKEEKYYIIRDRLDVYRDFTINLIYCINHYYLDRETLNNNNDIENHFNFCFNKVCEMFNKEEIYFSNNKEIKKYFLNYYVNQYYKAEKIQNLKYHIDFWNEIFDVKNLRNKTIANILAELYEFFDSTIENKKQVKKVNEKK